MRIRPGSFVFGAIGLAAGTGAVLGLREATLSTHRAVPADSEAVVELRAEQKGAERERTLDDMVHALLLSCRLEVGRSELVDDELVGRARRDGWHHYTAVFRPGLDETNKRQLRGCLEDWTIDHLQVDVLDVTTR